MAEVEAEIHVVHYSQRMNVPNWPAELKANQEAATVEWLRLEADRMQAALMRDWLRTFGR